VKFVQYKDLVPPVNVGAQIRLVPENHSDARLNGTWAVTSRVKKIMSHTADGPIFSTQNTTYRPCACDDLPRALLYVYKPKRRTLRVKQTQKSRV
jgi:hypothetical protein